MKKALILLVAAAALGGGCSVGFRENEWGETEPVVGVAVGGTLARNAEGIAGGLVELGTALGIPGAGAIGVAATGVIAGLVRAGKKRREAEVDAASNRERAEAAERVRLAEHAAWDEAVARNGDRPTGGV